MPDDNNNDPIPKRPDPGEGETKPSPDEQEIERPSPVDAEKEGISETKEESGLIERPKPDVKEYAEDYPREDDNKE